MACGGGDGEGGRLRRGKRTRSVSPALPPPPSAATTTRRNALDRALERARTHGFAVIEAEVLRASAELSYARGDRAAAIALAREAVAVLERLGAEADLANLRAWIAALGG